VQVVLEAVAGEGGERRSAQDIQALLQLGETPAEELVLSAVSELLRTEKKLEKRPSPCDAGDAGGVCDVAAMPGRAAKRRTKASASGGSRISSVNGQAGGSVALPRSCMLEEDECQEGGGGVRGSASGMVGRLLSLECRLRAREAQVCYIFCFLLLVLLRWFLSRRGGEVEGRGASQCLELSRLACPMGLRG